MSQETATVAEQEYLEIVFWLEEAGLPMTGANVARAMQLSPPTVHEMIGRLIEDGYVERSADKSLEFTASGREHASHIVRRHRMIERFLTDVLGIPWDEVHEEAERIEHAMSPVLEERMRAAIGDATTCPHGHPIVEGAREQGSLLADVEIGAEVRVLRFENEAEDLLHYLKDAGLSPGLEGKVAGLRRGRRDDRLRRGLPPDQPQRRRDGLGPRRSRTAAARGDPRAARPLLGSIRPLGGRAGAEAVQRTGDTGDTLGDLLRRHRGEGEPDAVLAALQHEVGAGDEADALALCLGQQRGRVAALREVEPEEVAAAGDDELGLGDLLPQGCDERVAALAQRPLDELDVAVKRPGAAQLQHDRLGQHVGRDVGLVGPPGQLGDLPIGAGQVADAHPGADRLGERGGVDDAAGTVHREHRLQRLALEGQLPVGIVLEDPEAMLGCQLDQAHPLLGRERAAGRIVEVGDDVGELDRPRG